MIFFKDNQVDLSSVSSDQSTVQLPVGNIQDQRLSRIFRGEEFSEVNINGSGSLKNISSAYTNEVLDPTDLLSSGPNWIAQNGAITTTEGGSISGYPYTKIENGLASTGNVDQDFAGSTFAKTQIICHFIIKKGNTDTPFVRFREGTTQKLRVNITFSTKDISYVAGTSIKFNFTDDETVEVWGLSDAFTIANATDIQIFNGSSVVGDYVYATAIMIVDDQQKQSFPFIDGFKITDTIDETAIMPSRFIFDIVLTPFFNYNNPVEDRRVFEWESGSARLMLFYQESTDDFRISWFDGGVLSALLSAQFDDGSSFINLNQKIRFVCSLDLISEDQNNSRFIVIPLESGNINEDSTWSVSPDIKVSDFTLLNIGYDGSGAKLINSEYEYIRIYPGLLVGTVNDSDDVDELLEEKGVPLFDKTYQQKLTATDILIANNTINDGDIITLRANDVDSFNPGSPLDEIIDWTKNITKHNFIKSKYQYWQLAITSSNIIDIGRVYLGERYVTAGIEVGIPHRRITTTNKDISAGGQSYGDKGYFASVIQTRFPKIIRSEYNELVEIWEEVDKDIPFFITFDKGGNILETLYVTSDQDELRLVPLGNRDLFTTTWNFIQEVK